MQDRLESGTAKSYDARQMQVLRPRVLARGTLRELGRDRGAGYAEARGTRRLDGLGDLVEQQPSTVWHVDPSHHSWGWSRVPRRVTGAANLAGLAVSGRTKEDHSNCDAA